MKNQYIIIFILVMIVASCNENFWGYNYDAPPLAKLTRIQGNLIDKYSGNPVHPATVIVNGQETETDANGNYLMNYIIPDEIEPNQQEVGYLTIIAPDYIQYNSTFIIYPVHNNMDIELEYSPPIILDAVSHGDPTQAIIRDYQGTEDISFVSVTFLQDTGNGIPFRNEIEMNKVINLDMHTAYYQFRVDSVHLLNVSQILDWFRITARDKSDNVHRFDSTINPDSSLLF